MKQIVMCKGQGKTTEAVRLAVESGAYMVVRPSMVDAIRKIDPRAKFPLTYHELTRSQLRGVKVVIDDVEEFLRAILPGVEIVAVTMTPDDPGGEGIGPDGYPTRPTRACPGCGMPNFVDAKSCGVCGWPDPDRVKEYNGSFDEPK